jgi:hypothetical protein
VQINLKTICNNGGFEKRFELEVGHIPFSAVLEVLKINAMFGIYLSNIKSRNKLLFEAELFREIYAMNICS